MIGLPKWRIVFRLRASGVLSRPPRADRSMNEELKQEYSFVGTKSLNMRAHNEHSKIIKYIPLVGVQVSFTLNPTSCTSLLSRMKSTRSGDVFLTSIESNRQLLFWTHGNWYTLPCTVD
ncbi:hypothetical protein DPMN_095205 [Dreissena polymorpha]|uniref:Uncharacterized protein n=1 Tax=Dreissena polymorpha TaxID=45954 RepID=A0A9D4R3K9_DREPO|nr:hypothetical protein DPMN_095205 [Dreissena polymorpha]